MKANVLAIGKRASAARTARLWRLSNKALAIALLIAAPALTLQERARAAVAAQQSAETLDTSALILEVARNEKAMLARRLEYTWTAKITDSELNKRGEVTKQSVSVYEVYPVRGEFARKLVARDGVPVSQERAGKELKKTAERLEKAAQEEQKRSENKTTTPPPPKVVDAQNPAGIPSFGFSTGQRKSSGFSSDEISFAVWRFFRYCEFRSPRRERLRDRDTIVLDFRPRADFRPADEIQKPYARLAGRVWIDATDRSVIRLEAWPVAAQPAGADSTASHAEPAVVFEHERMPDGVWLERFVMLKTYGHKDIFNGIDLYSTKEASDFQRFSANTGDEKLDALKQKP